MVLLEPKTRGVVQNVKTKTPAKSLLSLCASNNWQFLTVQPTGYFRKMFPEKQFTVM